MAERAVPITAADEYVAQVVGRHRVRFSRDTGSVLIIVDRGPRSGAAGIFANDPAIRAITADHAGHVEVAIGLRGKPPGFDPAARLKVVHRAPGVSAVGALAD